MSTIQDRHRLYYRSFDRFSQQNLSNNLFILPDLPSNRISIPSPIISSDILGRSAFLWEILSLVFTCKIFPPLCIFSYWLYLKCGFTLNVQSAGIQFWTQYRMVKIRCKYFLAYRIRRNNRTCLNKRTPPPYEKSKKKKKKKRSFFAKFNPRVSVRVKFNPNPNPMVRFLFFLKG